MGDGLLLHRGIHDHALQGLRLDGLHRHRGVDRGLEQLLQTFFAQVASKAADLCGVTGLSMLVVVHAAEELPQYVLAPPLAQLFVAQVEAVLEVEQAGHQANGRLRPPGIASACADQRHGGAQQVLVFDTASGTIFVLELRRQRSFDLGPGNARGKHRQRAAQVDHGVDAAAKEVRRVHRQIPQKSNSIGIELRGFDHRGMPCKASVHAGPGSFAGPTA